jgi:predicted transcriptional regulator
MATKKKKKNVKGDPTVEALEGIKRLLILQLTTSGVTGKEVASVLGVDASVVSRLVGKPKTRRPPKK